jgi:hypothetical protein
MISQTFPGRNVATSLTRQLSYLLIKCTLFIYQLSYLLIKCTLFIYLFI